MMGRWVYVVLVISLILSLRNPKRFDTHTITDDELTHPSLSIFLQRSHFNISLGHELRLEYDYYRDKCPDAEKIVRSKMAQLYSLDKQVPANLLRLFFHDCFIMGCDASVFLDDSNGNESHPIERQAIPSQTLKGFDKINLIKEELEEACPGMVSCADALALATRDGILLAGGPYYPVFTGRRDSIRSYFQEATAEIPGPDDDLNKILHLFSLRGFSPRETVSLIGAHNIGKISCQFIRNRLYNFSGTGQPDPTMSDDFLVEMRVLCGDGNQTSLHGSPAPASAPAPMRSSGMRESTLGMNYYQRLSTSISSGAGFDAHYYQNLLRGRGLLHADQQLLAEEKTAKLVWAYASDCGTAYRTDFARVMLKMSNLGVLSGSQGQVRTNCSLSLNSS